ncbi:hypothetical protein VPH35_032613 [Triticum aestivum]
MAARHIAAGVLLDVSNSMGRIRKVCPKDAPLVSSVESADSSKEPFVPNDFADDNAMSLDCSGDDVELDKALYNFYVNNKVKLLKRKLSSVSRMNVRQKRSSDYPVCATFTRYSGKFFSPVVDGLCSRYKGVIQKYGMGCLLNFVRTEVPLRLVKWLASRFDVPASEFQLKRKFIPLTKYDIHDILDLPVDCEPVVSDPEAGRDFILSHFNLTKLDRNNSRSFGKRPLKRLCAPINMQGSVEKSTGSNKSVSFNSAIANGVFAKSDGIPEVAKFDVVPEVAKSNVVPEAATSDGIPEIAKSDGIPEVVVQQESRPAVTLEVVTPIVPPAVMFGGLHNPVVLSSSSTPAKLRNEAVAKEGPVPVCTLFSEDKAKDSIAAVPPKGISPSKSRCEITDVDSFVLLSDGPAKDCDDKDDVNAFGIPSLAELNRVLGIQPPANVCNDTPVHAHEKSTIEDTNSFRVLSPLLPIRLSQYFHNECSQYVVDRYLKSFNSPNDEVANSPELEILSDMPVVSSAHLSKVASCSKVTAQERRNHLAMVQIASHPEWCKYEAIRYERAYCSYRNLSSLQFKSRVDNFLILCVCRYLFNEAHPSVSKKHLFFSYIGETILDGTVAEIVGNAFNDANSAFPMWRSNMVF